MALKKENPNLDNKTMVSKMSLEWNNMNDNDKLKYMKKAEEDRKRYEKEKAAYDEKRKSK